jgi:hypothetical protein
MSIDEVLARLESVKSIGSGYTARCPAHDDRTPSLSIAVGDAGRVLLKCHSGCSFDDIVHILGLRQSDLIPAQTRAEIQTVYDYHSHDGTLRYQVVRYHPKDFRQRQPDGTGYRWNLKGVTRLPYQLPKLQGVKAVVIAEGEADCDTLWNVGLPATTNAGGAGKWDASHTKALVDCGVKRVAVIADNDEAGKTHADTVATSCLEHGFEARIVTLPDVKEKGDVSDYLQTHSVAALTTVIKNTPLFTVAAIATPKKKAQGRQVELETPVPWPTPVNGAALLDDIERIFSRHLILPDHAAPALALWVMHAYTFDAFFTSPLLAITSPVKRCAKTLLLIVAGALVPRRLYASNITAAVLFRVIEKYSPTLLIDEADTFMGDSDTLRGVINSGHTRTTASVIRASGDDFAPRVFSTWCPKVIASIRALSDTLADRSIEIAMRRKARTETIEPLRQDRIDATCQPCRQKAARWADDHLDQLRTADPNMPTVLHDRAADCWRPLLAIADAAEGDWSEKARQAAAHLSGQPLDTNTEDINVELLIDTKEVFAAVDFLTSSDLADKLAALDSRPWGDWRGKPISTRAIADRLRPFGIHPDRTRTARNEQVRGYFRHRFEDPWNRYVPDKVSQRPNGNSHGAELDDLIRHKTQTRDTLKTEVAPMNTETCDAVTGSDQEGADLESF